MIEPKFFDYVKMISQTKEIPEFDAHFEKEYNPFIINRFFSLMSDTSLLVANAINKNYGMSKKNHFLFLHGMVRKGKRFHRGKWPKMPKNKRIEFLMDEYDYSHKRATEASRLITDEQIIKMKEAKQQGGAL